MGSAYHLLCPRYSGTLTPTAPTATRLLETVVSLGVLITGNRWSLCKWSLVVWQRVHSYTGTDLVEPSLLCSFL